MAKQMKKQSAKVVSGQNGSSGKKQVNWVLVLIMSVIFGQLGVDRFMMGHIGLGILKLITLGGCGIWWIIDLVLIATKHPFKGIEWVETH
jgi:TM2 domain-containing membrane protein YozV